MKIVTFFVLTLFLNCGYSLNAKEIFVNPSSNIEAGDGSISKPFLKLSDAIEFANSYTGKGSIMITLLPGIYTVDKRITINPKRNYTKDERYIIRAAIMPGDTNWNPLMMPVISSSAGNSLGWGFDCSVAFMVKTNHVSFRGLKFVGNPNPNALMYYPIGREDTYLNDLEISQCLFTADRYSNPIQVAVLVHGKGTRVDHCVFYNCRNAVVFWKDSLKSDNAFTHNIVYGAYQTALWTSHPDENFTFRNNIITHCNFAWIKNETNKRKYIFENSIISENEHFRGEWQSTDTLVELSSNLPDFEEKNIDHHSKIKIDFTNVVTMDDQFVVNLLHPTPDSPGRLLNAGLFLDHK